MTQKKKVEYIDIDGDTEDHSDWAWMILISLALIASLSSWFLLMRPPDSQPSGECALVAGNEYSFEGEAENIDSSTSSSGNTYYTFTLATDEGCNYDSFSWSDPSGLSTFSGTWEENQFGNLQFQLNSEGGPGRVLFRHSKSEAALALLDFPEK